MTGVICTSLASMRLSFLKLENKSENRESEWERKIGKEVATQREPDAL